MPNDTPQIEAPVAIAGAEGNSVFPGTAANEILRKERAGVMQRYAQPPQIETKRGPMLDRGKLKALFLDAPEYDWKAFCARMGYDAKMHLPERRLWERDKRYRRAWSRVQDELERESEDFGPQTLLRAVRAGKNVPATFEGMLTLLQGAIQIHLDESVLDQKILAANRAKGQPTLKKDLHTTASTNDLVCLSTALKMVSEGLYTSLGVDSAAGIDVDKWNKMVEQTYGKLESNAEEMSEGAAPIDVEIIGATDVRTALAESMERYLDKPGAGVMPMEESDPIPPPMVEESGHDLTEEEELLG